ncbi:SMI1/KNR4 family protein [Ruminococcus sp. NK3A76]|uniref:SMI1/KNR4 family protein n=1 Tax=Ruminococcus sp. NK3A76 TaxID=877411 RepID=UPI00048EEF6E|nr:SMI1/KNR4 family protein [Ruminococcus sp. NK3A76]
MAKQYNISAAKAAEILSKEKGVDKTAVLNAESRLGISFPKALEELYLTSSGFDLGAKSRVFAPAYISRLDGEDTAFIIGTSGDRLACIFSRDLLNDDPLVYLGTLTGKSLDFSVNQKLSQFLAWVIFEAVTEIKGEVIGVDDKGEIDELAKKLGFDLDKLTDGSADSCIISLDDETGELVFVNTDAAGKVAVMIVVNTK